MQQDYTVDEAGATLNAVARTATPEEEERLMEQMQQAAGQTTTSIFIRDWKVSAAPAASRFAKCSPRQHAMLWVPAFFPSELVCCLPARLTGVPERCHRSSLVAAP